MDKHKLYYEVISDQDRIKGIAEQILKGIDKIKDWFEQDKSYFQRTEYNSFHNMGKQISR